MRRWYPVEFRTMSLTLKVGVRRPLERPWERLWAMKGSQATGTSPK
jgi:hypothetical protein